MDAHGSYQELIPAYAWGATDPEEALRMQAHLQGCPACQQLYATYANLREQTLWAVPLRQRPSRTEATLDALSLGRPLLRPTHRGWVALLLMALLAAAVYVSRDH